MHKLLASAALFLIASSPPSPTAVEEFAALNQQAHAAKQAGDKGGYLQAALRMRDLLNDAPSAVEATARAYEAAGDSKSALAALDQYADLGQADDSLLHGENQSFSTLRDLPEYKRILARFTANASPVSRSEAAFSLSDPDILAEDIDYDPHSKSFLITSVLEKKIIRVTATGTASDFAASPSKWPVMAIKIDAVRNRVWATEVSIDGFDSAPKADWGRSALLCFDLHSGALLRRVEGPAHTSLGDMALAPNGDPIVSDGDGGGLYRLIGNQIKQIDKGDFISPQTPAMHPDRRHLLVPDYVRGIGILDLRSGHSGHVTWLNRGEGKRFALSGIDGLYFNRGSLILTQNGSSPERVVRMRLNSTLTQIVSEEIIERATLTLGDPTHGVVVGNYFYYIANSGWSELDEHGNLKPGSKLTPAHIERFQLS